MQVLLTGRVKEGTGPVIGVRGQLREPVTGSLGAWCSGRWWREDCLGTVLDFILEARRSKWTWVLGSVTVKDGLKGEKLESCFGSFVDNPRERVQNDQRQERWGCKTSSLHCAVLSLCLLIFVCAAQSEKILGTETQWILRWGWVEFGEDKDKVLGVVSLWLGCSYPGSNRREGNRKAISNLWSTFHAQ